MALTAEHSVTRFVALKIKILTMTSPLNHENLVKITFTFEIIPPKEKGQFDFKELVTFLDQIEHIHENALRFAYKDISNKKVENKLLDFHRLKFEKVNLDKLYRFSVSFNLDLDLLFPYYLVIKTIISLCEKYGKNLENLMETFKRILLCIQNLIRKNKDILRRIGPKTIGLIDDLQSDIHIKEIEELLTKPRFSKVYDFFCKTAITFKSIISFFEFMDQTHEDIILDNNDSW
jgi:hypothetical protein